MSEVVPPSAIWSNSTSCDIKNETVNREVLHAEQMSYSDHCQGRISLKQPNEREETKEARLNLLENGRNIDVGKKNGTIAETSGEPEKLMETSSGRLQETMDHWYH